MPRIFFRHRYLALITLAFLMTLCAGCDLIVDAVQDGVADFLESTVANLLQQVFPVPTNEGGG